jgi:thioredoxin reductase (NADPH)
MAKFYDAIIIGSGPAGLTAALYLGRAGQKCIILEKEFPGGYTAKIAEIENYPGHEEISGFDLTQIMQKLEVPGAKEFLGKGVSYCATCDGMFFKGKVVAVVGSEDEAAEEAHHLADLAARVKFIPHKAVDIVEAVMSRLKSKPNVEIHPVTKIHSIVGDELVTGLKIVHDGIEEVIPLDGVFIAMGSTPISNLIANAGGHTDDRGCLLVDRHQRMNIEGVFAAGDCTCGGMQIVTAAGEGAVAGMRAAAVIRRIKAKAAGK